MSFFESFSTLGYSSINILLLWVVFLAVGFRVLRMQGRHWIAKTIYFAVLLAVLVFSINFLADQNRMLNDAIRADGGLKRTDTK